MSSPSRPISRTSFLRTLATLGLGAAVLRPTQLHGRATSGKPFLHPEPRPGITAANVLAVDQLPRDRAAREAYATAREYPAIFDGVFCACRCNTSLGHRSLLSCFETKQPVGCQGCRDEAALVGKQAAAGKTLEEIRAAVDAEYG
jgi:hypothetical protein